MAAPDAPPGKMTRPLPDFTTGGALARFAKAARAVLGGFTFTLEHPGLLPLVVAPILIQLALFLVFVVGGGLWLSDLAASIDVGIAESSTWHFVERVIDALLVIVAFVGAGLVGLLLTVLLGGVIAGPFLDALSSKVEVICTGTAPDAGFSLGAFARDTVSEAFAAFLRLGIYLLGLLVLLLAGFLPLVGQTVVPVLSVLWSALFIASEILNAPLARHQVSGARRLGFMFGSPMITLGAGLTSWLLLFIPVTMPFLVVGGTRLALGLARSGRAPFTLDPSPSTR